MLSGQKIDSINAQAESLSDCKRDAFDLFLDLAWEKLKLIFRAPIHWAASSGRENFVSDHPDFSIPPIALNPLLDDDSFTTPEYCQFVELFAIINPLNQLGIGIVLL